MGTKKILDFSKYIDGFEVVNLEDEEVKKLINDDNLNIYNIFSSLYHSKFEKVPEGVNTEGIKYKVAKCTEACLYCTRDHLASDCPYVICKKCGERGHLSKKCNNKQTESKSTLCKKCAFASHSVFDCPAVYREYKIDKEIEEVKKTCGNCAGEHFVNDCPSSLESSRFSIFDEKYLQHMKNSRKKE
ncbi:TRAMP complex RNA-binding subunit [Vairimorpha necatrix]|uniref:TRAMP complex RNA-binding subunit n=1 Tax=Vairimorpha necatrix TaxID=6039 RepID=A0AAX4J8I4_9MICR